MVQHRDGAKSFVHFISNTFSILPRGHQLLSQSLVRPESVDPHVFHMMRDKASSFKNYREKSTRTWFRNAPNNIQLLLQLLLPPQSQLQSIVSYIAYESISR